MYCDDELDPICPAPPEECHVGVCGDGVLGLGEQCDFGTAENTGGYNGCTSDCRLDTYCGDGIYEDEYEDCDDGNFMNDDDCWASCQFGILP